MNASFYAVMDAIGAYVSANPTGFGMMIGSKILNWKYYFPIAQNRYEELRQNLDTVQDYLRQYNLTGEQEGKLRFLMSEGNKAKEEWEEGVMETWTKKTTIDTERIKSFVLTKVSPEFYAAQMGAAAGKMEAELLHLMVGKTLRIPSVYSRRRRRDYTLKSQPQRPSPSGSSK